MARAEATGTPGPAVTAVQASREDYVGFDLHTLRVGSIPSFDLYIRVLDDYVLYRHHDLPFDDETASALMVNGIDTLYVDADAESELTRYCEQHLASVLDDRQIAIPERAEAAVRVADHLAQDILHDNRRGAAHRSLRVATILSQFVTEEPDAITRLVNSLGDRSTLQAHSANTSVYAVALARHAADPTPELVAKLATAGLVHDVGLSFVTTDLLQKPSRLSREERKLIEQHPVTGEQLLRQAGGFPEDVLRAVRWHHERLDGSGYPENLKGWAVPWIARALAIAEVFDALTSTQPWRARMSPSEAIMLMLGELRSGLDVDLIRMFVPMLRSDDESDA